MPKLSTDQVERYARDGFLSLYLGGRRAERQNWPLLHSGHAGERECREGVFRHEGLCPVFYEAAPAVKHNAAIVAGEASLRFSLDEHL